MSLTFGPTHSGIVGTKSPPPPPGACRYKAARPWCLENDKSFYTVSWGWIWVQSGRGGRLTCRPRSGDSPGSIVMQVDANERMGDLESRRGQSSDPTSVTVLWPMPTQPRLLFPDLRSGCCRFSVPRSYAASPLPIKTTGFSVTFITRLLPYNTYTVERAKRILAPASDSPVVIQGSERTQQSATV